MTQSDAEMGFPGNREMIERELRKATTQALYLAPDAEAAGHRSLLERGADAVRGMELMPAEERFWTAAPDPAIVAAASKDGIPPDIAEAYIRAKTEVKAILADAFPT